jgi:chitinase
MSKKSFYRICLCLYLSGVIFQANAGIEPIVPKDTSHRLLIAGYLANYRIGNFNFDNLKYIDRLYYFSVCPNEKGQLEIPETDALNIREIKARLSEAQSLYLVVGGWTQSKNIPLMASTKSTRKAFVKGIARFCKENGLQGVDLDWEDYPNEVKKSDFYKLVKEFNKELHSQRLAFTIALGVSSKKIEMAVQALPYVDEINVMSYGKFDKEGNQAPMGLFQNWLLAYSAAGIPKEKLIVGVPFYGKRLADSSDHSPISITFSEISLQAHPSPTANWFKNYSYNGLQLIGQKTRYLKENGYQGVMAWEVSQDLPITSDSSLLKRIYEVNLHQLGTRDF